MPGLRERKRRQTVAAIHHAAMRLFAERGYDAVTITDIAEAAEVGRATVFAHYRAKEDLVLGDAGAAVESLRAALAAAPPETSVVGIARAWMGGLVGWVEPDVVLQRRLAAEVPAVAAARSRLRGEIERVLADALAGELSGADPLAPRLVAGALAAAMDAVEAEAAARMARDGGRLGQAEVDALFDTATAFVDGGLEQLRG